MELNNDFAYNIAALAQRAILYEVSTTPKPGLVDRHDSGAHKDMDFFTFMASSSALFRGLYECAMEGVLFEESDSTKLMDRVRVPGMRCEEAMFKATNGVNTHKGIIFSMGILCAVTGKLYGKYKRETFMIEDICNEVKEVSRNLIYKDFEGIDKKVKLTHGERLFKEYGIKGIRGEVESGFSTVRETAVPIIREWYYKKNLLINDMFLQLLMSIMTKSQDTNILIRGGMQNLIYAQSVSKDFLKSGGMNNPDAKRKLECMNKIFIKKNISPGGAADLLAVSIFLGMMEGIVN